MTPQEQQLLKGLTDRVNGTRLEEKDPEAEQFIFQQLGRNTDSLYIMAQTILVQQYALDNAQKQLADLKQQLDAAHQQAQQAAQQAAQQPVRHTSFLGSLLGHDDQPAPPPPPPPSPYGQQQYQPVQTYQQPPQQYAQPVAYGVPMQQAQGGGFLRGAMQTAAGVAAGAVAFEGIESLMHGFGSHAGYGNDFGGGFGGGQPREEVINNYYNDSGSSDRDGGRDLTDRFAAAGDTPSPDIEDRRDDPQTNFADTGNDDSGNDDSGDNFADDGGSDDGGTSDDDGSFDDGSSSDDSGF